MKFTDIERWLTELSEKDHVDKLGKGVEKVMGKDIKVPESVSKFFKKEKKAS